MSQILAQPFVAMFQDEIVVIQVRVLEIDAVDFFHLPGDISSSHRDTSGRQANPAGGGLRADRDAAVEAVGRVEEGGIGIGDFVVQDEEVVCETAILDAFQEFHRSLGPD
jgi:hypothetical protein